MSETPRVDLADLVVLKGAGDAVLVLCDGAGRPVLALVYEPRGDGHERRQRFEQAVRNLQTLSMRAGGAVAGLRENGS